MGKRVHKSILNAEVNLLFYFLSLFLTFFSRKIFLDNLGLLKEVREEAGRQSLASESGTSSADRRSEFGFEFPGILPGLDAVEGHLSEKTYIPAANLVVVERRF